MGLKRVPEDIFLAHCDRVGRVLTIKFLLLLAIRLYVYVLIGRIIVEMIHSFSRQPRFPSWFAVISEPLFLLTDPPVKLLRRLIPPLRLGQIALDLSVLVLFFLLQLLSIVVHTVL